MRFTPAAALAVFAISALACSESPTESRPADTAPDLSVSTASQVAVYPGQSIQAAVNSHPAGTTFLLKAGTHRNQAVVPKAGDVFLGEAGTVLDGGGTTRYAFDVGGARPGNVRIQGLVIQNYAPGAQRGAVNASYGPSQQGTGWVVANCEIHHNRGAGLRLSSRIQVLNNKIHHNDQIGATGDGDYILFQGNEVAYNNPAWHYAWGWELGGVKFTGTHNLVARGNYAHHNNGPGLWTDVNNIDVLYENNRAVDNAGAGIFHEISYAAVIRNNVATGNGLQRPWVVGAGILVSASPNVEVYGNSVSGNRMGIVGMQQSRGSGAYGPHVVQNLYVHDNTTQTAGMSGIARDWGPDSIFTGWNNRFRHNTYTGLATNRTPFTWMNGSRTVAQWKGYGQDVDGIFK